MSDVAAFVHARLDEWEQAARHAGPGQWRRDGINSVVDSDGRPVIHGDGSWPNGSQADHIALNDPARVLAQATAMRRMLDLHSPGGGHECSQAGDHFRYIMEDETCETVRHMAAIWDWHEDYDSAWAPKGE